MPDKPFLEGDMVNHKTGGPIMLVTNSENGWTECRWWDYTKGTFESCDFDSFELTYAKKEQ